MLRPDAEAAVGQPLPQTTENAALRMCDYNAQDFSAGASLTAGSWESIKAAATGGHGVPTPVGGVGDEALALVSRGGSALYVRVKAEGFLLTLNGPKISKLEDGGLALEKTLASKIAARL